jgi:peptidoglycan DL-endopeptidase CwlO
MRKITGVLIGLTMLCTVLIGSRTMASAATAKHHLSLEHRALDRGMTRRGDPYVFGAAGPHSFDCSGLVQWSYRQVGKHLPRTSQQQWHIGRRIRVGPGQLRKGDLIFMYPTSSGPDHVGEYVGSGDMLNAAHTGTRVRVEKIYWREFVGARRIS